MKFLESYRDWQIYEIPDGFAFSVQEKLTGELATRYIAIEPSTHRCVDDITVGSLKSQIDEYYRY